MTLSVSLPLLCVGSYLIGGVPVGLIAGKMKGIDVRLLGSGNIGATNVGRLLGVRWGVVVFVLDALKGALPTVVAGSWLQRWYSHPATGSGLVEAGWLMVGICAVLGHNFSLFLRFRGGKGVATSLGVALGVHPHLTGPALTALLLWLIVVGITRVSAIGSIVAAVAFPLSYVLWSLANGWSENTRWPFVLFTTLAGVLVVVRHRANIARMVLGNKMGERGG